MNIQMCAYFCQLNKYFYSGVQNGNKCFCGNGTFGSYGIAASDRNCNSSCSGYSGYYCGGSSPLANSIYATSFYSSYLIVIK
jgi:hypothetical protein